MIFMAKIFTLRNLLRELQAQSVIRLLVAVFQQRILKRKHRHIITFVFRSGVPVHLRANSSDLEVLLEVCGRGEYECVAKLNDVATFVDLGANVGVTSLFLWKKLGFTRLLAVEPEPRNFQLLNRNLDQMRSAGVQVELIESALWTHDNGIRLQTQGLKDWSFNVDESNKAGLKTSSVTMKSLLERLGTRADLVKMDIEGAELSVLEALGKEELSQIHFLAVEFHRDKDRSTVKSRSSVFEWLGKSGGIDLFRVQS